MQIVFFSVVLNNHQANVADELWKLTNQQYRFVELANLSGENKKGDTRNYDDCPYLIRAWQSENSHNMAMELAQTADCCVFGPFALEYQIARMKRGLLSFDMGERWLKKGWINVFSPHLIKWHLNYHLRGWKHKPLYKLCMSAFAASDHQKLGAFKGRCYKWGYFTKVEKKDVEASPDVSTSNSTPLMWCSRYLMWKHPELPILMAARLKRKGYHFILNMYGSGEFREQAKRLARKLDVEDVVRFFGNKPNDELMADMRQHEIFLFTSDKNEGWGAVANESMANGCALIASEAIGSTPYLIKDGVTGLRFRSPKPSSCFDNPDQEALHSLCEKVEYLLDNPELRKTMQQNAVKQMREIWSPKNAARNLLTLIDELKNGKETSIENGPCSKA